MKRRLITSALPYVNNVPHLGNLIQVLSADVFARFCRLSGYETLYVCGTDEYGTATETKAHEEGVTPRELCDRFHAIHKDIYSWFNIDFDHFGRTSTPEQTEIVQEMFLDLKKNGYIKEQTIEQLYCDSCKRFLADRYVRGTCPHCGYEEARGDQCEHCGKLLEPTELKSPKCSTCGATPHPKSTDHLYIDLPSIRPRLEAWMKEASVKGFWANNAIQMTQAWIRDGLKERAITRDLKWGIPVPQDGFRDKVFYVWFDAPIGYISISACKTKDWKSWWQNPDNVELYQFIGKDNIPFHTVIFPSSLLGSGKNWTMLHHMSSSEYLNYESGKFSKSKGIGVFGTDAKESGISADAWRFYIYLNRPEKSDVTFTWKDFQEKVNGELIGNVGNLVNRTLTFVSRYFDGVIPEGKSDAAFWEAVVSLEKKAHDHLERAELRDGLKTILEISDLANKKFQDGEPWKTRNTDPEAAKSLIRDLCYVLKDLSILLKPYIPESAGKIASFFGKTVGSDGLTWKNLGELTGLTNVKDVAVLFTKLEDDQVAALRERYAGSQKERAERDNAALAKADSKATVASTDSKAEGKKETPKAEVKSAPAKEEKEVIIPLSHLPLEERFMNLVDLRAAKITKVERHPKADKLYIETLDDGTPEGRVIVSGLVPYYKEEELLGKTVVVVANLKPAKLRGTMSAGMLLAASKENADGTETVEALDVSGMAPGTRVLLQGDSGNLNPSEIDIDAFFTMPIRVENNSVMVGSKELLGANGVIKTSLVQTGEVG